MTNCQKRVLVRSSKYLNNLIEQDHRRIKQRLLPILGLKSFETADIVIDGIELAEKIKNFSAKVDRIAEASFARRGTLYQIQAGSSFDTRDVLTREL